jgi:aminoglycoside 6'-N-acetyltransferase I
LASSSGQPAIEIRRVGPGDVDLLERVAEDVFDAPIDPMRLAAYLASPGHHLIVAVNQGEVVGQVAAVVHRHPDKPMELYIDEVGVAPTHQRRGIARSMLAAMFELGRELGCEQAWVVTEPDNQAARRLYESKGGEAEPCLVYVYEL